MRHLSLLLTTLTLASLFGVGGRAILHAQATVSPLMVTTPTPVSTPAPAPRAATATATPRAGIYAHAPDARVYAVKPGDTLLSAALEVGIDLADAYCMVRPNFDRGEPLVIGNLLKAPPPGTICHEVAAGETLASIAEQYALSVQEIVEEPWNELPTTDPGGVTLVPGHHLRIPPVIDLVGGAIDVGAMGEETAVLPLLLSQEVNADVATVMAVGAVFSRGEAPPVGSPHRSTMAPVPADWPYGSGQFGWPMPGWLTQGYKSDHRAIDVAAPAGTVVTASDRGEVIRAGWNDQGYGRFVIIDHNIDYITLYAHLSEVLVKEGEIVAAGQPIGRVGSSGNSTGPHLHFEIRDFGQRIDPLQHLMR